MNDGILRLGDRVTELLERTNHSRNIRPFFYVAYDEVQKFFYLSETHPLQWEYRLVHYAPGQDV